MLIATDGLWDVMSSQAAVDYAKGLLLQESLLGESVIVFTFFHLLLPPLLLLLVLLLVPFVMFLMFLLCEFAY